MRVGLLFVSGASLVLGSLVACGGGSRVSKETTVAASDGGAIGDDDGGGASSTSNIDDSGTSNVAHDTLDSGPAMDASSSPSGDASSSSGAGDAGAEPMGEDGGSTNENGAGDASDDAAIDGSTSVPLRGTHTTNLSIRVNGTARTYDVSLPTLCEPATKVPLIFIFHPDEQTASYMYQNFPIEEAAALAEQDAVYVYPNGLSNNQNGTAWNIYDDPGAYPYTKADPSGNDDVDFFDALVASFASNACADLSHVFVTGFSSGAYFTHQIARWRSSIVKAAAPQSGGPPAGVSPSDYAAAPYCVEPTGSVPTLVIHGQSDTEVDPTLGEQGVSYWDIANSCTSAASDCNASSSTLLAPPATPTVSVAPSPCVTSLGCATNEPVVSCFIPGMNHSIWSGAPAAIWSFFSVIDAL